MSDAALRRATAVALVAGPAFFLLDNLLHPTEFARGKGNEAQQLREIADHATRWQLAHLFGFVAIVGFAVAVLGLVARAGFAPAWAAVVLGAGVIMVGLEVQIVSRPFWIVGSVVFLVGGAAVGGSVFRPQETG